MHEYEYINKPEELLTPEVVQMLGTLRECKGRQDLYVEAKADVLTQLLEVAKIQSTGASNRIEGIYTSDERLRELVREKSEPRNRSEEEIAGYREVLAIVHENYEYITPRVNTLLQMHKELYAFSGMAVGGRLTHSVAFPPSHLSNDRTSSSLRSVCRRFKTSDNIIEDMTAEGERKVRFQPVPTFLCEQAVGDLCLAYQRAMDEGRHDPLLLTMMFVLDFLCIHPFSDGNGRMSRLLTLLLLYRSGFIVGKYISVEMLIEKSKEQYYETLQESSKGWHENENTYLPFVRYMLGVLVKAYREFEDRVEHLAYRKLTKGERVKEIISRHLGKITKREILTMAPDISEAMVEKALADLLAEGFIEKVGNGRGSGYQVVAKR